MGSVDELVAQIKKPTKADPMGYAAFKKLVRLKDEGVHEALLTLARTRNAQSRAPKNERTWNLDRVIEKLEKAKARR